jgi:exportin-1
LSIVYTHQRILKKFFYFIFILQIQVVQKVLSDFQNHSESWTRVDVILEKSSSVNAKYIALSILSKTIQFKWKIIQEKQQTVIKNYIVNTIIKKSSNPDTLKAEHVLVKKLDEVLVQV